MTAETLDQARERLRPYVEAARGFSGWLHNVETKVVGHDYPWDYLSRARELVLQSATVLDMGTGGGERFAGIIEGFRGRAVATEEWHVNAPVANERLKPLGVSLLWCDSLNLPLADASFEVVLDRHEALDPAEVARVLKPGGRLLTQQVVGDVFGLRPFFPRRTAATDHYNVYKQGLTEAGMSIVDAGTFEAHKAYRAFGDLVYVLCTVPWEVPDFDPLGADLPALLEMEAAITTDDGFVVPEGRYIIEAVKSGRRA